MKDKMTEEDYAVEFLIKGKSRMEIDQILANNEEITIEEMR